MMYVYLNFNFMYLTKLHRLPQYLEFGDWVMIQQRLYGAFVATVTDPDSIPQGLRIRCQCIHKIVQGNEHCKGSTVYLIHKAGWNTK